MLTLVVTVLGLATIGVGLYVLSQTPIAEPTTLDEMPPSLVIMPQTINMQNAAIKSTSIENTNDVPVARGSELWCEEMMNKADSQWPDKDAMLFAQNCIYE